MKKLFHRFLIGLFFALPIVGLALFLTQISADAQVSAQDVQPTPEPQSRHNLRDLRRLPQ